MRVLLAAAVSLAAAAVPALGATPRTETLYGPTAGTISAFSQDGPLIAWFAPGGRACNTVHVRSLVNPLRVDLPTETGAHNVTCRWSIQGTPVSLAIAGNLTTPNVLWTLYEASPLPFDYLVGAGVRDRRERRFQQLAHTTRGAGLWLGGVAGDGATLAYAVTSVDYVDEAGCLAGTDTCDLKLVGGGVYNMAGGQPKLIAGGTTGAVAIAASTTRIAYLEAGGIAKNGRPDAGASPTIDVVAAADGRPIATVHPQGTPLAIALAPHILAALERTPLGLRVAWYSPADGKPLGSAPIASTTSPALTVSDTLAVFHVGRSIRAVDLASRRVKTLITAAAIPVGLSIEGTRIAWAENSKRGARIRALYVG